MKTRLLFLGVLLLSLAAMASAQSNTRKEIEAVYAEVTRYMLKGDCDGIANLLHPSFREIDATGTVRNKAQTVAMMKQMVKMVRNGKGKIVIDEVHESKSEVVARITMIASMEMKNESTGKWERMSFKVKMAETLIRTPDGWRFTLTQHYPEK